MPRPGLGARLRVEKTADGRPIKILTVTDEYMREASATPAARRIGADDSVSLLERIVEWSGQAPQLIRCDDCFAVARLASA